MNVTDPAFAQWQSTAQSGELEYHVSKKPKPDRKLEKLNRLLFESFGFKAGDLADKTVVDIGAGSHLRTRFFTGAQIHAVEPLAEAYMEQIPWCELKHANVIHTIPAEQRIDELTGKADLVVCINVLDHTYDPETILDNIHSYLHEDGQFLLSVDLHGETLDGMHPVELTDTSLADMLIEQKFTIDHGYRYLSHRRSYGHGDALTFIAHKRRPGEPEENSVTIQDLRTPGQLRTERLLLRGHSICRRIKRVLTGESRAVRRLLGRAA